MWYKVNIYIGQLLSQAATIILLLGKTLPGLLKLQNFGNSPLVCSNILWHFYTPRFFPGWTMVRWWSQRLRENDLWRPITSEPLNGIVCGRCHFNKLCGSYHLNFENLESDNIQKFVVFGPNIPKYPQIDPHAHDKLLKMVALAPTVPIFNRLCIRNLFGPILTCFNVNKLQKDASDFGLARSWPDPGTLSAP